MVIGYHSFEPFRCSCGLLTDNFTRIGSFCSTALPYAPPSNTWQISVTDETAAEAQLLRVVMEDSQLTVTEFGRKKHNLEEVFMSIVGEEQHVG
jgi:hypothetical protein